MSLTSLAAALLWIASAAPGNSGVASTRHNLSVSGPGNIKSSDETEICIFCHVSHHAGPGPLTNRPLPTAPYRPYESSTLQSEVSGRPTGASRVCLSCHDGTIALGQTLAGRRKHVFGAGADGVMPPGRSNLGTDHSGDHPFSFRPARNAKLRDPAPSSEVRLDGGGRVQCTSCHDPHREDADPVQKKFLVRSNRGSALCLECHALPQWATNPGAHQSSTAAFDSTHGATTGYLTVAESGCASCHQSHGTRPQKRLMKAQQDDLCLQCHSGRVARLDLGREVRKPHSHLVSTPGFDDHDAAESPASAQRPLPERRPSDRRHASCVDCHDPHAAFARAAEAPRASGALAGVWGIDRAGMRVQPVAYEYEVCFKCHADSANQPQARGPTPPETIRREVTEVNLLRLFGSSALSYHPVVSPGRNPDVPSLLPPLTPSSQIYCSDCHGSDQAASGRAGVPRGPHGSTWPHLLERNLSTADRTIEGPQSYALCYKCHDRDVLLSDRSAFRLHARHVRDESTPCTACHASHGVSALQGTPSTNAHLMDFDVSIVGRNGLGQRGYRTRGPRAGSCSLSCHGSEHRDRSY